MSLPLPPVFVTEIPEAGNAAHRRKDRERFVEMLKARPGHWAQYKPGVKLSVSSASVMRHDFPGLQTSYRRRDDGGCDIYARWMGQ